MNNNYMPVVTHAEYISDYKLNIAFDNGEIKQVDCAPWLRGEVFEPLKDMSYFRKFFVDGWSISWPNGADIAPETLYMSGQPLSSLNPMTNTLSTQPPSAQQ